MKLLTVFQAALLSLIGLIFISPMAIAANKVQLVFEKGISQEEKAIQKKFESDEDIRSFKNLVNDTFKFSQTLTIAFGGDDGPLYDPEHNEIIIPYVFIEEVKQRFQKDKYAQTGVTVEDATMDALIHTLFHELAHALVAMYSLPVVGKEEDAADSLATILLIDFYEEGQEIAISAADLFYLESEDIEVFEEQDFWGEHSLDAQRYYSTLCLVYGSDPEKYAYLINEEQLPQDWGERCLADYENTAQSWDEILMPYLKQNQ